MKTLRIVFCQYIMVVLATLSSYMSTGTPIPVPPTIVSGDLFVDNSYIDVTFSEPVWGNNAATIPATIGSFQLIFNQNGGGVTSVDITDVRQTDLTNLTGGEVIIRFLLNINGTPTGVETIEITPANGSSVFNGAGEPMSGTETTGPINLFAAGTIALSDGRGSNSISSLVTTPSGQGVFSFIMSVPSGGPGVRFTELRVQAGPNNEIPFDQAIAGAELYDDKGGTASDYSGVQILANEIVFQNINDGTTSNIGRVPDGESTVFYMNIWLLGPLPAGADNSLFEFEVSDTDFIYSGGDQVTTGEVVRSSDDGSLNRVEVVATEIAFGTQPSNTNELATMVPPVTVRAVDQFGNVDIDNSSSVSLTSSGDLNGSPLSATAVSGVATFSNIIHNVPGNGLILSADAGFANTTSNSFNIFNIAPSVSSLNANPVLITDADNGATFSLTINFNQDMDTGVDPSISFPVEDPTATLTFSIGGWNDLRQYRADYMIADADQGVPNIDITISGAADSFGGPMTDQTFPDVFSIQMNCNPQFNTSKVDNSACNPAFANGSITIDVTAGTGDYTVQVTGPTNPPNQTGAGPTFTMNNLESGTYTVTVIDNGTACQTQAIVDILDVASLPVFTVNVTDNTSCISPNGEITASLGVLPVSSYRFELFTGALPSTPNSLGSNIGIATFSNLAAGTYYLQITEVITGCTTGQVATVQDNLPAIVITTDQIVDNTSCGTPNGSVSISVTGASGQLSYSWSGPSGYSSSSEDISSVAAGNYTVTVTDQASGCVATSDISVGEAIELPFINSFTTRDGAICAGTAGTELYVTITGGTGPYDITIDQGVGTVTGYNSGDAISVNPTATTTYALTSIVDALGCSPSTLPAPRTVVYDPGPIVFDLTGGGIICDGTRASIQLSGSETGITYNLLRDGIFVQANTGTGNALNFSVDLAGTYTVDALTKFDCGATMNGQVVVQLAADTKLTGEISGDSEVCLGSEGYTYSVPDQNNIALKWVTPPGFTITEGAGTNQITVKIESNGASGNVQVSGVSDCGETEALTFPVTVLSPPAIGIQAESEIFAGVETTFSITSDEVLTSVSWDFGDGGSDTGESVLYTYAAPGNYRVTAAGQSEQGCIGTVSRTVRVGELAKVVIKNVITANGDGQNDLLWIEGIEDYPRNQVTFLDRWGVEVASFNGYQNDWDLTDEREKIPSGNYLCIVKLETGDIYSMTITVMR